MITFRPAKLDKTPLLIGIAGCSGSGKTYSALRMAKGIQSVVGGKVFMIDTEARRGLHYAKMFDFQHGELNPPFRPEAYSSAIQAAVRAGATVIIIDSTSHEHEGQGGILEWQQEEVQRMAGDDYKKREAVKFSAWIQPKAAHNKFVNILLQTPVHVIFCFRAKDKIELRKIDGKIKPTEVGWQPICADRLEYEMTALVVLPPNSKGVPDLEAQATKIQEQHRHIIKSGKQLSEEMGAALAKWANGDTPDQNQGTREEAPVNQESLQSDVVGGDHHAKALNPLFSWQGSNLMVKTFPDADEWATYVISGIEASKDLTALDASMQRNKGYMEEIILAGYHDAIAKVDEAYQNKCRNYNPLRAG
jgi:hypothetical protein